MALTKVPDDNAAKCLSDLIGGTIEIDDAITTEMICASGYSKCIRNVSIATKRAVYKALEAYKKFLGEPD